MGTLSKIFIIMIIPYILSFTKLFPAQMISLIGVEIKDRGRQMIIGSKDHWNLSF